MGVKRCIQEIEFMIQPTKRPSLVEAERILKEYEQNNDSLIELIEKLILKNK